MNCVAQKKVKIIISKDTCERLRQLGSVGESPDAIINRILNYVGFHTTEFIDSES